MADQHGAGAQALDEGLQPLQAVQVEVVGGLVQEEEVVAGEQQRGEAGPGGLAAGEGGHRQVEADLQPERVGDLLGALLQVGAAEVQPAVQAHRVRVVGAGAALDQALGGLVQGGLRGGDAGTAGQEVPDGLARAALRLLREVPDVGGRRAEPERAALRGVQPGHQPQQGRLARAVGPDQADDVAGGDDQVEPGEEGAVAVAGAQVFDYESGAHDAPIIGPTGTWWTASRRRGTHFPSLRPGGTPTPASRRSPMLRMGFLLGTAEPRTPTPLLHPPTMCRSVQEFRA